MRIRRLALVAAVAALGVAPALAKDTAKGVLAEAKVLAMNGADEKAAARFGDAASLAQKDGDLATEEEAAREFREFFERAGGGRGLLSALLAHLDPDRAGARLSAPAIARSVLFDATEKGGPEGVKEAAEVLIRHRRKARAGAAAAALADYAEGMRLLAGAEEGAKAPAALTRAREACVKERWADFAIRAGTEEAAACLRLKDEEGARKALAGVCTLFEKGSMDLRFMDWRGLVAVRLKDAPEGSSPPTGSSPRRSPRTSA